VTTALKKEVITTKNIDKYVLDFAHKNISVAANITFTVSMILLVLVAAGKGGSHSINSVAKSPDSDTIFYRIDTTIRRMENQFWRLGLQFLRDKRKKLKKCKCFIAVDETYDSYTGRLLKKLKRLKKILKKGQKPSKKDLPTLKQKKAEKYIHTYKPDKGDTGSFKYLVFALIFGNKRRVLRVKALKKKEKYDDFIIKTLVELKKEVSYECALFDRGFYKGLLVEELKKNQIPFILRAPICKTMKRIYGFYREWKMYDDYEIGEHKIQGDLVLGVDYTSGKRTRWAFITNMEFENWYTVRNLYRKRWNIENIFKATDGIQIRMQTSDPTTRFFSVCFSFLLYNAWQMKNKRKEIPLQDFVMDTLEKIFAFIVRTVNFYRDRLRLNISLWKWIVKRC